MTATTRAYHDFTVHTPASVRATRHVLDWDNEPRRTKQYPDLDKLALPEHWPESTAPAPEVLAGHRPDRPAALDRTQLARLLFYSAGVTRPWKVSGRTRYFRAMPSAGALYPNEVYVACGGLGDLEAGLYHYAPGDHALHRLAAGDPRGKLAGAADRDHVAQAPLTLVLTGIPWRTTWKYQVRGYRHLFWDAGAIAANCLAAADAVGLDGEVLAGFDDAAVAELLGLPGEADATGGEVAVALVPVGGLTAESGPDRPEPGVAASSVQPLSPEPSVDPQVWQAHEAGALTAAQVPGWREALAGVDAAEATAHVPPAPAAAGGEPLEQVILRRGSTRRFALESIPEQAATWSAAVAARPVAGDLAPAGRTLLAHLLAVHAVDGLDAGAYRWDGSGLASLGIEATRRRTASLCLDQPHGGESALTAFLCADLDALLEAAGDRAYRAAQLEAGIAAERLQLAAFACGVGATGLTFYDEEVRRFFDVRAEPMMAVAVGPPAYRPIPGRRPAER